MTTKLTTKILAAITLAFVMLLSSRPAGQADQIINGVFTPTPTNHKFAYLGVDDGWQERLEQIQGVRFLNAAGNVQEALQTMGNAGLNAVRVTVELGQFLTTTPLTGTGASNEALASGYNLDYGGVDLQVDIARRAKAAGMKVIVTIDMGYNIPGPGHDYGSASLYDHWQTDNYSQMLDDIKAETIRLLDPFLQAGIQPDIIVASDETDGGILGHSWDSMGTRTLGGTTNYTLQSLAATNVATGDNTVYPKFAGFMKEQINAAKGEVQSYFGNTATQTRYALHCKGGSTSWYYGRMFSNSPASESVATWNGQSVTVTAVTGASQINSLPVLADLVDVLGISYYFNTPTASTQAAYSAAFLNAGNNEAFPSFISDLESWGLASNLSSDGSTYASGIYQGEQAKKCLIMETDTGTYWSNDTGSGTISVAVEQQFINYCFQQFALPANDNLLLGAMWWEGEYGEFTTDHSFYPLNPGTYDHEASPVLATWGQYGRPSPNVAYSLNNTATAAYMTGGQYFGSWNFFQSLIPQTAQTFHVGYNSANDSYTYTNDREGGILGVWSSTQGTGAHIELTQSSTPPANYQEWDFVSNSSGSNQLINVATGLAMDNQGSPLQTMPSSSATQQWTLSPLPHYNIVNVANGLILDSGLGNLYAGQYASLQSRTNNSTVSQQWSFISDYNQNLSANTYYRIVSYHILNTNSNLPLLLSPYNNSTIVNDHIEQTVLNTSNGIQAGQEWSFTSVQVNGQTAYRIVNRNSGLALDESNGNVIQATPNNSSQTQLWQFVYSD